MKADSRGAAETSPRDSIVIETTRLKRRCLRCYWSRAGSCDETSGWHYAALFCSEIRLYHTHCDDLGRTRAETNRPSNSDGSSGIVNPAQQDIADRVRDLAEEVITGTSYFLVDVAVRGHKGTRVVEVYMDSAEEFGHDDLAVVSKELGFLLDVEDAVDGSYKLEVSSPGIKRPLQVPQQYQKNVGRTLRVRYEKDGSGEEIVVGDLMEATDDAVELELSSGDRLQLPYRSITQARVELPW